MTPETQSALVGKGLQPRSTQKERGRHLHQDGPGVLGVQGRWDGKFGAPSSWV